MGLGVSVSIMAQSSAVTPAVPAVTPVDAPAAVPAAAPSGGGAIMREETRLDGSTQKIERIHIEDDRVQVDEVRSGGETDSITVKPKANVPAYDVQPVDMTRPQVPEGVPGGAGQRTWKVLSF